MIIEFNNKYRKIFKKFNYQYPYSTLLKTKGNPVNYCVNKNLFFYIKKHTLEEILNFGLFHAIRYPIWARLLYDNRI